MGSTIRWDTNQSFACTQDGDMVQKIIAGDLIIPAGVTITTQYRCKGLHIQVMGNMYLYGTIDMTARGANAAGANVGMEFYSDRNLISLNGGNYAGLPTIRKIAAAGANGAAAVSGDSLNKNYTFTNGNTGSSGSNGQTGGGGSGIVYNNVGNVPPNVITNRPGGPGTSFSGGPGSGGVNYNVAGTYGGPVGADGGAGGSGVDFSDAYYGGGGAGNPGGYGRYPSGGSGESGTGGLIIISVLGYLFFAANAYIKSNGSNGGAGGGAGSGGGSINIFYATLYNNGSIQAYGGNGTAGMGIGGPGGNGGAGSIRLNSLRAT